MTGQTNTLSNWQIIGGRNECRFQTSPERLRVIVALVRSDGWMLSSPSGGRLYTGPETGDAGKTAADRKAVELGWVLEGGVFGETPSPSPAPNLLGVWHIAGGRHVRSRWDKASMVMVHGDGSGWWWSVSAPRPDCGASASDCGTAACLDQAKEQADLSAERFGWSLTGGAFKALVPQAESKPRHRPYRMLTGSRARALREAAESAMSILTLTALQGAAFDLAWSVEVLDQAREAALKVGEEMAADLEELERERDEALRERNEAKVARDEALRQVEVERERADTNENLAREAVRLTRDFREEVTKASIAAFNLGWDAAIRCRDILKDAP